MKEYCKKNKNAISDSMRMELGKINLSLVPMYVNSNRLFEIPKFLTGDTIGVFYEPLGNYCIAAANAYTKSIFVDNYFLSLTRDIQIFALWHEIGHIVNGHSGVTEEIVKTRENAIESGSICSFELEADRFAMEILGEDVVKRTLTDLLLFFNCAPGAGHMSLIKMVTGKEVDDEYQRSYSLMMKELKLRAANIDF